MRVCSFSIVFICTVTIFAQTPVVVERELLGHLEQIRRLGESRDLDKLERENEILRMKLLNFGKSKAVLKYGFPNLKEKMFVTNSMDGRLRIYSWDSLTGGSARWFESIFQYAGKDGSAETWMPETRDGEICPPFYSQIFQLNSSRGPIYLANSTSICSTSLSVQSLSIFQLRTGKLSSKVKLIRTKSGLTDSISVGYDFFSVLDRPERPIKLFEFDERKQEFRFPVVIEDEKTPQGRVTNKFIAYRFNGTHFVKVK